LGRDLDAVGLCKALTADGLQVAAWSNHVEVIQVKRALADILKSQCPSALTNKSHYIEYF